MDEALKHLKKDRKLARLIDSLDPITWKPPIGLFEDIVESIVSQQLSIKASDTIFKRFKALFAKPSFPAPEEILSMSDQNLRNVGLSWAKVKYVKNLSFAVHEGTLDLKLLPDLSDAAVIEHLTKIKGIGVWTAEMILIFTFRRPDIFSIGDLGLRKAVANLYKIDINDKEKILSITNKWSPYRSLASRYLWKSLDVSPPPSI